MKVNKLSQLLAQHQEIPEHEILLLNGFLEDCNLELESLKNDSTIILSVEKNETSSNVEVVEEEEEEEDSTSLFNSISEEPQNNIEQEATIRSNQRQQKAELREKIGELENEIMQLVDQDKFDEADELEQQRIQMETLLNSL